MISGRRVVITAKRPYWLTLRRGDSHSTTWTATFGAAVAEWRTVKTSWTMLAIRSTPTTGAITPTGHRRAPPGDGPAGTLRASRDGSDASSIRSAQSAIASQLKNA